MLVAIVITTIYRHSGDNCASGAGSAMAAMTLDSTNAPFATLTSESISGDHGKTLVSAACQCNKRHTGPSSPTEDHALEAGEMIRVTRK